MLGVRRSGIAARRLRQVAGHVLRTQHCGLRAAVSLALVSDAAIRKLNRRFLGIDQPTDVLSFPAGTDGPQAQGAGARYLGDVVISVDRARVQARAVGHAVRTEIALLAVHGLLHLLGYDDRRRKDAAEMARRQRVLLREAGFKVAG